MNELDILLQEMIDMDASDIHLNHNAKISYRVDGEIIQKGPYITGDQIYQLCLYALNSEEQRTFNIHKSVDFSYKVGRTRFRGSLIYQKNEPSCVMRRINADVIPIDEMGLPPIIKELANISWGMILVTGPTGSGKSTTLASVIDYINESRRCHIATIEQPLEYMHQNKNSIVTQREVGRDTPSFAESMKDVLRQDPDVILVGEMRDYETISAAVTNAETGHLVLGTLHTNTAPQAISRIADVYPIDQHYSVRSQLAANLRAVVNQRLFPKPGGGRTALHEILIVNDEMKDLIKEGDIAGIYRAMEKYEDIGCITMDKAIEKAKKEGTIYPDVRW